MSLENILITGITGQDGLFLTSYLAKSDKKYNIIGISRQNDKKFFKNYHSIIKNLETNNIKIFNLDLKDKNKVSKLLEETNPTQIFNLSGPSSVYESIKQPKLYSELIPLIFNNLTNSCIELGIYPSFFQASSSEMFAIDNEMPLNEKADLKPRNPYSVAKHKVFRSVKSLKIKYDWNIKSGIMFNHESEFRDEGYLFTKIINAALSIKRKQQSELTIGSLSYVRDWSFAGDIAEAIGLINSYEESSDFVIGSGIGTSIEEVLDIAFLGVGLNYNNFVNIDSSLLREGDPEIIISDPSYLKDKLNWSPKVDIEKLINRIISFKTK